MSCTFGHNLKLSIFGQSHSPAIGMTLDGIPAGLPVDFDALQRFLDRRAPGRTAFSTPRKESDRPTFASGIVDGFTCGAPIAAWIPNTNTRPEDYRQIADVPRPGHADYTAQVKYAGFQDTAGGGHFSGRLTAPMCIAGGLCLQWLSRQGIQIGAHIARIGQIADEPFSALAPQLDRIGKDFAVLSPEQGAKMQALISRVQGEGDSIGGVIECAATGVPTGLGNPMFDGIENRLASILFGIPAVKGVEFGDGFAAAGARGSENNDCYTVSEGSVKTLTNHAGGILGGISSGAPILFRVAVKPTPSISLPQKSISLSTMREETLCIKGRHDPCIVPRAVPVVEAAAALALFDFILGGTGRM